MDTETIKDLSVYSDLGINTKTNNFIKWYNNGLFNDVDENFVTEVQDYWLKNYNKKINPYIHIAFMNLTGRKDTRLIPQDIMRKEILPVFNDYDKSPFYGDKNLYDIVINPARSVETVLRNINGNYFDTNHESISFAKANDILLSHDRELIIKPSQTNNGTGIEKIRIEGQHIYFKGETVSFKYLEEVYEENFMIQKVIQQHPNMAAPHPASVNTLRMVTFRWKNEIKLLLTFARFGSGEDIRDNGDVDTSPRIAVSDSGEFSKIGLSQNGQTFTHHPTTGFCFADLEPIPNFDEFKQFVIDCHKKILHLNFASWDIVIGEDGKPIFLEVNFGGSTSFYQLVTQKPIFGDLTEEVLEYVSAELQRKEPVLMLRHRRQIAEREAKRQEREMKKKDRELSRRKQTIKELEEKNKKLKKQRRVLKEKLEAKENELKRAKKKHSKEVKILNEKYKKIINSKSYRYTRPLRKLANWFK
ncbi:hypothetical protein KQI76_04280 [Amphibacillus sp. MSJ-3]|uniref:sugar-transfer associated ATP-grasp domain-containing protein n=1 Tax=Amphibacillus sp. MSJ-3 TaxID=2841505 RepID=UPI001C0EA9CA|nr:sugar-transfer associated ATP-grasp domain-containing protein [Amphibacillus sp. MSJ-3]MBU5594374.1 hypothetical protein [Amphibacillus sp. MSJ-3]